MPGNVAATMSAELGGLDIGESGVMSRATSLSAAATAVSWRARGASSCTRTWAKLYLAFSISGSSPLPACRQMARPRSSSKVGSSMRAPASVAGSGKPTASSSRLPTAKSAQRYSPSKGSSATDASSCPPSVCTSCSASSASSASGESSRATSDRATDSRIRNSWMSQSSGEWPSELGASGGSASAAK